MATLVLTVAGGIIGGPIGAAIGAIVGHQADLTIFAPKGREGPRLADMKVQASTYGQQIPQLFGTMRVAGTVIWATDLQESKSTSGGGKGRPSVTQYSYSASLAVALSSRRILNIKRVWADGNLLRSSTGRLYERGQMRIYHGGEDQPVDPLIASALRRSAASAFRGLAYVVFEDLQLGAFGNRIPSLTFEVVADDAPVDSGFIGNDLMNEPARCVGQWPIAGYAASGERLIDAVEPLFEVDRVGLLSGGGQWRLAPALKSGGAVSLKNYSWIGRPSHPGDVVERRRQPLSALPAEIHLRHYEPERDYQAGQQSGAVAGGGSRHEKIDLPAVLSAASARSLAAWLAVAESDGREQVQWLGDFAALALPIGGLVVDGDGIRWRVAGRTVQNERVLLELTRHHRAAPPELDADAGEGVIVPDWPESEAKIRLFDLPNLGGAAAASIPEICVAAASSAERWRGADLWFLGASGEEPVAIGHIRGAAAMGELIEPAPSGSAALRDEQTVLRVRLEHDEMSLQSIEDALLMAGGNAAMLGGELIQFGRAELEGGEESDGRTWRISRLLRYRGGEVRSVDHAIGTGFLLLDDPALIGLPHILAQRAAAGGAQLQWAERGSDTFLHENIPADAVALKPLSPVHGKADLQQNGDLQVTWLRRSRANNGWRDEVDVPLGEAAEQYHVTLIDGVTGEALVGVAPWMCREAELIVDAAQWPSFPSQFAFEVRQQGDFALSPPHRIDWHG